MSSGKWRSFCLGPNVLYKAATTSLLQCLMVFRDTKISTISQTWYFVTQAEQTDRSSDAYWNVKITIPWKETEVQIAQ